MLNPSIYAQHKLKPKHIISRSTQIESKTHHFMLNMHLDFNMNIIDIDSNHIKPTIII